MVSGGVSSVFEVSVPLRGLIKPKVGSVHQRNSKKEVVSVPLRGLIKPKD